MKTFLVALIMFFAAGVQADTTAKIDKILMYEGGNLVYIYPVGGVQNKPACHGSNGDYLSFSMARPMAKDYLSVLMMAFAMQKTVSFRTYRDCVEIIGVRSILNRRNSMEIIGVRSILNRRNSRA